MIRLILSAILALLGMLVLATVDRPYIGLGLLAVAIVLYGWYLATRDNQYHREYF